MRAHGTDQSGVPGWVQKAFDLLVRSSYDDALTTLEGGLKESPQAADAWAYRAWALTPLGRLPEALTSADKALEVDRNCAQGWLERGSVLYALGRYEEALTAIDEHFKRATDHSRCNAWNGEFYKAECWNMKGCTLTALERWGEALAAFDTGISHDLNHPGLLGGRAICLCNLKRYQGAVLAGDKALTMNPDLENVWAHKGVALANLGRYREAEEAFQHTIEIVRSRDQRVPEWVLDWHKSAQANRIGNTVAKGVAVAVGGALVSVAVNEIVNLFRKPQGGNNS